jgi:4-amino-4-deoxychorismate lyase
MCQLLETIRIAGNRLMLADYHSARVNYSRAGLFGATDTWDLTELITLPQLDDGAIYRCRFMYGRAIEKIEILPHVPRLVTRLILVSGDAVDYSYKFTNRSALEQLKNKTAPEPGSDILIVKNGMITDTSFSNIAFLKNGQWFTPAIPLLRGTKRCYYLEKRILHETTITPADLKFYQKARLINAMIDLEDGGDVLMEDIGE